MDFIRGVGKSQPRRIIQDTISMTLKLFISKPFRLVMRSYLCSPALSSADAITASMS